MDTWSSFSQMLAKLVEYKTIRRILAVALFVIFVYQSKVALTKFFEAPTVVIKSETSWDKIEKPRNMTLLFLTLLFSSRLRYL